MGSRFNETDVLFRPPEKESEWGHPNWIQFPKYRHFNGFDRLQPQKHFPQKPNSLNFVHRLVRTFFYSCGCAWQMTICLICWESSRKDYNKVAQKSHGEKKDYNGDCIVWQVRALSLKTPLNYDQVQLKFLLSSSISETKSEPPKNLTPSSLPMTAAEDGSALKLLCLLNVRGWRRWSQVSKWIPPWDRIIEI